MKWLNKWRGKFLWKMLMTHNEGWPAPARCCSQGLLSLQSEYSRLLQSHYYLWNVSPSKPRLQGVKTRQYWYCALCANKLSPFIYRSQHHHNNLRQRSGSGLPMQCKKLSCGTLEKSAPNDHWMSMFCLSWLSFGSKWFSFVTSSSIVRWGEVTSIY